MPSPEDIANQQSLLDAHRRTLAHYLWQRAEFGAAHIPPVVANGIPAERNAIRQIKQILRGWNIDVEDHPNDEERAIPGAGSHAGGLRQGLVVLPRSARIPYPRNQVFLGREQERRRIAELLARSGAAVVLSGLGGVGKTQLAAEFAHDCDEDRAGWPGGVAWLLMGDPATISTEVAGVGYALGIAGYDGLTLPEQVAAVQREWAGPAQRLLVFDNCEDPQLLQQWRPPSGGARVLITARRADWPAALTHKLELRSLPRPAARELLIASRAALLGAARERLAADPAADTICAQLGDLALALHMAAAYLAQRPHLPLPAYLAELRAKTIDHTSLTTLDDPSPTAHLQHIAQTIALSYELLADDRRPTTDRSPSSPVRRPRRGRPPAAARDPLAGRSRRARSLGRRPRRALALAPAAAPPTPNARARALLDLAAHCAPGVHIPLALLRRAAADDDAEQALTDDAIRRLAAIGLASYADDGEALMLHRLVAAYALRGQAQPDALAERVAKVLRGMTHEANETGLPATMSLLLPHARYAADTAEERGSEHAAPMLNNLGSHLHDVADFAEARTVYERALRIFMATFGSDHPKVATCVNNLGMVAHSQGDLENARALFERALRIFEQHLGDTHPYIATLVNNLGIVAKAQGDLESARALLERALRIDETIFGPDHPKVAIRVNNLGTLALDQGDLESARILLERALRIFEQHLGDMHPNIAILVNNLGGVTKAQGDLESARILLERALRIFEQHLGDMHPNIATLVNNLGSVVQNQGDLESARALLERALRIDEAVFGPDHPNVARDVNNLGVVAKDQGDLESARALLERALRIIEQTLGPDHPKTLTTRRNLAGVLAAIAAQSRPPSFLARLRAALRRGRR